MKETFYCTYFNHNFCPFGLSLLESLSTHDSTAFIFVLCLDDDTYSLLKNLGFNNVQPLQVLDLEKAFPELLDAKANRSNTEYYWTLTPYLIFYLIFRNKLCTTLTYLDADQFFYSDPKIIFDEIGKADIAIMPHRFPSSINSSREHGEFNVSWLTFRNTPNAEECLEWWKGSCLEWCYAAGDETRYGDQKYLDDFPKKFNNVHIIENLGCGVAPWNLVDFDSRNQLILFHFQSFRIQSPRILSAIIPEIEQCNLKDFKRVALIPYFNSLKKNFGEIEFSPVNQSDKSRKLSQNPLFFVFLLNRVFLFRGKFLNILLCLFTMKQFQPSN